MAPSMAAATTAAPAANARVRPLTSPMTTPLMYRSAPSTARLCPSAVEERGQGQLGQRGDDHVGRAQIEPAGEPVGNGDAEQAGRLGGRYSMGRVLRGYRFGGVDPQGVEGGQVHVGRRLGPQRPGVT